MKRLLFALVLALGMHGLLFGMEFKELKKKFPIRMKARVMTMTLAYQQPKKPKPKPIIKKQVSPNKKPAPVVKKEKKKKRKRVVKPKPQKKIIKQKKIVKLPAPSEEKKPPKIIPDHKPLFTPKPSPEPEPPETAKKSDVPVFEPAEDILHDEIASIVDKETTTSLKPVIQEAIPRYQENPPPKYPGTARRRGYQGTTILEVLVNKNGRVGDLKVFKSSGHPILDRTALASVKNWSFEPGMRGDEKVEMWVKVPIRFQLK